MRFHGTWWLFDALLRNPVALRHASINPSGNCMALYPTVIRYMYVENTETILRDSGKCMRIEVYRLRLYIFLMQGGARYSSAPP